MAARTAAALFLMIATCGCRISEGVRTVLNPPERRQDHPALAGKGEPSTATLARLAVEQRVVLSSLRAQAAMRIQDRTSHFSLTMIAHLYARSPDKLRLSATKAAGQLQVLDAVVIGDEIACWVPSDKILYQGKVQDLDKVDLNFHPQEILNLLLRPAHGLLLAHWRKTGEERETTPLERCDLIVLTEDSERPHMRLAIDRRTGDLRRWETLAEDGEKIFVRHYSRWQRFPIGENGERHVGAFPYRLRLEWPRQQRTIEISFRAIEPDVPLDDEDLALDVPEGVRTKNICDVRMEGDQELTPLPEDMEPAPDAPSNGGR